MRKVAIVGLPNSGKSTLFNRLTGRRRALVHRRAGMTRDRLYGEVEWRGRRFTVIDTGGVDEGRDPLQEAIRRQLELAMAEADLVIILMDGTVAPSGNEVDLVQRIRKAKEFILAVNKIDAEAHLTRLPEYSRFGSEVYAISAEHGRGVDDLLDTVLTRLPDEPAPEEDASSEVSTLTIVGRPNSGKSTLLNRIVGYERASVSEVPGTTRDTVDAELEHGGRRYRILDTAGIRRRSRVEDSQEIIAALAAHRTIEKAHCTLLIVDGAAGIAAHDKTLAAEVAARARSVVVLVNKVDCAGSFDPVRATKVVREELNELSWARVLHISALTGRGTGAIMKAVSETINEGMTRVSTPDLNRFLERLFEQRTPLYRDGVGSPIRYAVQTGRLPIAFQLFATRQTSFIPSYEKMLVNQLRSEFGLQHSIVRIVLKGKSGRRRR